MGKELWGHMDRSDPTPNEDSKLAQWKIKDVKIMTWMMLASIDPLIVQNLNSYKTTKSM